MVIIIWSISSFPLIYWWVQFLFTFKFFLLTQQTVALLFFIRLFPPHLIIYVKLLSNNCSIKILFKGNKQCFMRSTSLVIWQTLFVAFFLCWILFVWIVLLVIQIFNLYINQLNMIKHTNNCHYSTSCSEVLLSQLDN